MKEKHVERSLFPREFIYCQRAGGSFHSFIHGYNYLRQKREREFIQLVRESNFSSYIFINGSRNFPFRFNIFVLSVKRHKNLICGYLVSRVYLYCLRRRSAFLPKATKSAKSVHKAGIRLQLP